MASIRKETVIDHDLFARAAFLGRCAQKHNLARQISSTIEQRRHWLEPVL